MTLLRRHLAPIDNDTWKYIEDEARSVFKLKLNGRKVVDTIGPKGLDYAAYNTGRINKLENSAEGVDFYIRDLLPLVHVEVPFSVNKSEIEALIRGSEDIDIDNLLRAADKLANIENNSIFYGLEEVGIEGFASISSQEVFSVSEEIGILTPVVEAVQALIKEDVAPPYNLLVGPYLYTFLHRVNGQGYPLERKVQSLIGGNIIYSEELGEDGVLVGNRDDDFQLVLGQDISIGFKNETNDDIEFFFTESFTFKINAPEAVVVFKKQ